MNDDNTSDEYEDEPSLDAVLDTDVDNPDLGNSDLSNKGVGVRFVLVGFVVASLLGGFIGIVVPKTFQRSGQAQQHEALIAKLGTLTQTVGKQDGLIQNLTDQLQKQKSGIAELKKTDERLLNTQQTLRNSLAVYLERDSAPELSGNKDINNKSNPSKTTETAEISDLTKPDDSTKSTDIPQAAVNILMDTFPRAKMLAAVLAQEKLAEKKPGLLRRTLRKHIKFREGGTPDPRSAIDAAETAVNEGRIQDALDIIAKLNPVVRAAASEWVRAAKKTLQ